MDLVGDGLFTTGMDRPLPPRRIGRPVLAAAAVAGAGAAAALWLGLHPAERTLRVALSQVTIASVEQASFHDFVPLHGQVVPLDSVVLDAVQGGRVEEVLAEAGQRVVAGQPLIRLSDPTLELDAIARETQIIEQMNSQRSLQLTFELTKTSDAKAVADADYNIQHIGRQVARRVPLAAKGYASQESLDQATDELAYQQRLKALAADALARDAVVIKRSNDLIEQTAARLDANLEVARKQIDALIVRAPADGVLTSLAAHVGEEKTRGERLGQVDRDSGFRVTADVDEFYLSRVTPGQHVTVTIDGVPRALLVAKVYPQVKAGEFAIDLTWDGAAPSGLRRGQAVQGKLALGEGGSALVLASGAFLDTSGGAWVFVLDRDGTSASRRAVKLGRRNAETVEVLSGLQPGDRVITSDYSSLERIDRLALSS